jgi:alkyldihydroxyacetonephosphate synthase
VLDWAGGAQASVTPFGGGSSVVGGVEPQRDPARHKGTVTIDLRELGRVIEVDKTSRAARIEAGAFGPALEAQLKPHNLTLRHFPQSFECSTLGGWIATRSGGHFASLYTHIDDFVESLRVVTPKG